MNVCQTINLHQVVRWSIARENSAILLLDTHLKPSHEMTTVIIQDHKTRVHFFCHCNGLSSKISVSTVIVTSFISFGAYSQSSLIQLHGFGVQSVAYFRF